jgi:anoctamin-1
MKIKTNISFFADLAWLKSIKRRKMNIITNASEPNVSFWKMKFPAAILSVSVVLLLIVMAIATMIAVILYRLSVSTSLNIVQKTNSSFNILFTTTTAAVINLILIVNIFTLLMLTLC